MYALLHKEDPKMFPDLEKTFVTMHRDQIGGGNRHEDMANAIRVTLWLLVLYAMYNHGPDGVGLVLQNAQTLALRMQAGANSFCANPFSLSPVPAAMCGYALRASTEAGLMIINPAAQPVLAQAFALIVALYTTGQLGNQMRNFLRGIDGFFAVIAERLVNLIDSQSGPEPESLRKKGPNNDPSGPGGPGTGAIKGGRRHRW